MRPKVFVFCVLVFFSFGLATAQDETPVGCAIESIDGQPQLTGDMSQCTLEDFNAMYKFLEEQVAGGFDVVDLPQPTLVGKSGDWDAELFLGVTDQMKLWAMQLGKLGIDPVSWNQPFNVDLNGYSSRNGFEYDATQGQNSLCEQKAPCSLIVNPSYYRLVTADGTIPELGWNCKVSYNPELGCALVIFNVGDAANFQSRFENGFTITGQFFNGGPLVDGNGTPIPDGGEAMPVAISAVTSFAAHNMVNADGGVNVGGNCSRDEGCDGVRITVIVVSGNQMLLKVSTVYVYTES